MTVFLSEAAVELALLEQLCRLGYSVKQEENNGPDGHRPERGSHDVVVLKKRLEDVIALLNPGMPSGCASGCDPQDNAVRAFVAV